MWLLQSVLVLNLKEKKTTVSPAMQYFNTTTTSIAATAKVTDCSLLVTKLRPLRHTEQTKQHELLWSPWAHWMLMRIL